jgi:tetratricopeptide (TPR) repeat protein
MRKGILFLLMVLSVMTASLAQESKQNAADTLPPFGLQQQMFIYSMANKYNDYQMSKSALYNILSYAPGNTAVMDSLALLYYQSQQYISAALLAQDILKLAPNDMLAAEIAAVSFESLGVPAKAIPLYEKIYFENNDLSVLYQIAFLQFQAGRFNEAKVNVETIIGDNESSSRQLVFPMKDNRQQQVPLKAGAYRLMGMIEGKQGNIDAAREAYDKALEITPIFESVIDLKSQLGQ